MTYQIKVIKHILHINIFVRKLNIYKYKCSINAFYWKYIYSEIYLELLYDKLINDLVELFNLIVLLLKSKKKYKQWLYNSLIKCINKKNVYKNYYK